MKKLVWLATAAGALLATPAMAAGGHVGVGYNSTNAGTSADIDTWQAEGAYGANSGALGFQFDGSFGEGEFGPLGIDHWRGVGHVFWDGGDWRLGGVLGVTSVNLDLVVVDVDLEETMFGVEGTYDLGDRAVIGASYTMGQVEYLGTGIERPDAWNLDASLSYYVTENFRLRGALGIGHLDFGIPEDNADTTTYGLSAEWQPFSAPVSLQAGWSEFESDVDGDVSSLSLTVRWNFGGSLRERDNVTPFQTSTPLYQRIYGIQ